MIPCLQDGMFLDGVNYANVANNLADGKGTIWHFTYSDTFLRHYTHQLPLMLWGEALAFWIFGDSIMVERLFCLLLLFLSSHAVKSLWQLVFPAYESWYGWPLLLWLITPIIFWGYANNVQELMMTLTSVWSVYFVYKGGMSGKFFHFFLAGIFCFLCSFCKGVQGLFPLAAIPLYQLLLGRKGVVTTLKQGVVFATPIFMAYGGLAAYAPSRAMLIHNFDSRLKSTFVSDVQDTANSRLELVFDLAMELLVPIAVAVLVLLLIHRGWRGIASASREAQWFFVLVGLSASLPLMVTLEQRRFYLITSIGYFAIAIAGFSVRSLASVTMSHQHLKKSAYVITFLTLGALVFAVGNIGTVKRDRDLLHDVHLIGQHAAGQTVGVQSAMLQHYELVAYLARYYNISVDNRASDHSYTIVWTEANKDCGTCWKGHTYTLVQNVRE